MKSWRQTPEYRRWRIEVVRRDKKCVICGSMYKRSAHHIANGQHHPELRFDVDNGVTLCGGRGCHNALHTMFKPSYRHKTTKKDWLNFLDLVEYIRSLHVKVP